MFILFPHYFLLSMGVIPKSVDLFQKICWGHLVLSTFLNQKHPCFLLSNLSIYNTNIKVDYESDLNLDGLKMRGQFSFCNTYF